MIVGAVLNGPGVISWCITVFDSLVSSTQTQIPFHIPSSQIQSLVLANDGADVYSVDINSIYLFQGGKLRKCDDGETPESCVRKSTIVVTGVPTKAYRLPTEWIQPESTVVNVASFKNVDEEKLLQVPGVTYVPMVGKVTVAMLERNLMRLYENFHHPDVRLKAETEELNGGSRRNETPWYAYVLQLYTAFAVTALLAVQLKKESK